MKLFMTAACLGLFATTQANSNANENKNEDENITHNKLSSQKGECHGINTCKGKGHCGGGDQKCAGRNECKGKGWLKKTEQDCKKLGGEFKPLRKH